MKALLFSIFILTLFEVNVPAQIPSSCVADSFLFSVYNSDAKELAVNRMYAIHSADTALINIPVTDADTILNGMAAIFYLDTVLQADSVFRRYCIHKFIHYSLSADVDLSKPWAQQWEAGNTVTGYGALDTFMSLHGFTVTGHLSFLPGLATITITTSQVINIYAFGDSLLHFAGVYDVKPAPEIGSPSSDIEYYRDTVDNYSFTFGWVDCPSGCMNGKTWNYQVDDRCNVTLVSAVLDERASVPEPAPANCFPGYARVPAVINALHVQVYPNPVNEVLNISVPGSQAPCRYTLSNLYGQIVCKGDAAADTTAVNLKDLLPGIYALQVMNSAGILFCQKIIKE